MALNSRDQRALEARMARDGKTRALSNIDKALSRGEACETPAGIRLTKAAIAPVVEAIDTWVALAMSGHGGRRNTAAALLNGVDTQLAAYLAVKFTINVAMRSGTLANAALLLGQAIDSEMRASRFEAAEPALFGSIVRNAKDRGASPARIVNSLKMAEQKFGMDFQGWSRGQCVNLGSKLVEIVAETMDIVSMTLVRASRNSTVYRLSPGDGILEWFTKFNGASSVMRPMYLPTLIPPAPWVSPRGGSYHTDMVRPLDFIIGGRDAQMAALDEGNLDRVYSAVNAVQDTEWSINKAVLAFMVQAWDTGAEGLDMPHRFDVPIPALTEEIAALETTDPRRRQARREISAIHAGIIENRADRLRFDTRLNLAKDFAAYDSFYFPHRCDFRGRVYSLCDALSPQGDDATKSLLQFANGKPVGTGDGATWFAVNGANLFGFDKVSFAAREQWVFEHCSSIAASARDPFANRFWTEADKPWCFLAWCIEWGQYILNPETFHSHLPIAMDGSCNGLQHFAAMLKDPVTGQAVNLTSGPVPSDVYGIVADAAMVTLRAAAEDPELPEQWMAQSLVAFGIDRKITKRPVMVLPYGGTFKSCMDYCKLAVSEKIGFDRNGEMNPSPFGKDHNKAMGYLARHVWGAMGVVVESGRTVMTYVQDVARARVAEGHDLRWTSPSGFPVVQSYFETKSYEIKTQFHGKVMLLKYRDATKVLDPRKQVQSASPNFVHSLDAAAMMLTINRATAHGITSFAMIHDSYGTHAADAPALAVFLRAEFVRMYTDNNVLADLQVTSPVSIPVDLPATGTLDLNEVLSSVYFFA